MIAEIISLGFLGIIIKSCYEGIKDCGYFALTETSEVDNG